MGPVVSEGEAVDGPAPVIDYKAAARGQRVPRMVAALESKIHVPDEVSNGAKPVKANGAAEAPKAHANGKDNNGGVAHEDPPDQRADASTGDGWEVAEAPGSHAANTKVKGVEVEKKQLKPPEKAPESKPTEKKVLESKAIKPSIALTSPKAAQIAPPAASKHLEAGTEKPIEAAAKNQSEAKEASEEAAPDADAATTSSDKAPVEEKLTRMFCLVRIPRPDSTIGSAAIREAESRLKDKREKQEILTVAVRLKQINRNEANDKVKEALERMKACREEVRSRMDQVKPLWDSQRRLQEAGKMANTKRRDLPCATEAELDQRIQQLEYTRQHESLSLNEEKQILREIRQLEGSREQVRANSALLSQYTNTGAERESISSQIKPLQEELEVLRAAESEAKRALDLVDAEQKELNKQVEALLAQREEAREEHQAAYEELKKLRQQAAQRDHDYYNNRRDIQKFKQLAAQRDIPALEEFANTQVESLMARFCTEAAFRAIYIKNNEISTLRRFGSHDTRSPGVDEDPAPLSPTPEKAPAKAATKEAKSVSVPPPKKAEVAKSVEKDAGKKKEEKPKAAKAKAAPPPPEMSAKPANPEPVQPPVDKEAAAKEEAEAKERRREEEMQKAKEAEERKRRAAEKKAAKAEQRRKREAEEAAKKKDKKKQTATPPPEAAETDVAAPALSEQPPIVPAGNTGEAGGSAPADEGARRRQKAVTEKKKRVKPPGRSKKSSLQVWLQANAIPVAVGVLGLLVLLIVYFALARRM